MTRTISLLALIGLCLLPKPAFARQEHQHAAGDRLGTVRMENTCTISVQGEFNHAMALLHSFEWNRAADAFTAVIKADPCGMAYWGLAMVRWSNPFGIQTRTPQQIQAGLEAVTAGLKSGPWTVREREYLEAAAKLFTDAATLDQRTRVVSYEKAMAALAAKYPNDREASIFWALSLTASALPTDKTYANQLKAGAILEKLYPLEPDHPGITHYIIHSYDVPALADKALAAAHRYAKIAPAAAHALHMPSHTFTRVGAWEDSIASNLASAAEAKKLGSRGDELHAMDYLAYAYLQTGQDNALQALMKGLAELDGAFNPATTSPAAVASSFPLSAIPARWALEHRDWKTAASVRLPAEFSRLPYTDAMSYFTRALGAAHTGALDDARMSIGRLKEIQNRLAQMNESYWAEQVGIQHDGAMAFLLLAEGKPADALALLKATAVREDATEKSAVTPGPLAPAHELLGDMLLELKRPAEALVEYQTTMKKEPNRFRGVYGAAEAAAAAGDRAKARQFYKQLLDICKRADAPGRPELAEARAFLKGPMNE